MKRKFGIRKYPVCAIQFMIVFFIASFTVSFSQPSAVIWYTIDGGAGFSTSSGNAIRSSVGETFVGISSNLTTNVNAGFLVDTALSGPTVGVSNAGLSEPLKFELKQNYPNPFNPSTTIQFTLAKAGFTTLKIYDILGKEVATIISEQLNAGVYSKNWYAGSLASGIYIYRLQAGSFVQSKKLILIK